MMHTPRDDYPYGADAQGNSASSMTGAQAEIRSPDAARAQLKQVRVGQLFAEQLSPVLSRCKDFSLSQDVRIPKSLEETLESPQVRAIAWGHLATNGLQSVQTKAERHALVAGLLSYLAQDGEDCWPAVALVTTEAARVHDRELYKLLGESALKQELSSAIVSGFIAPFAMLSTHNAAGEGWLKPWIEIFSRRGDGQLFNSLVDQVMSRVERGDRSSYDHLLAVLCSSPSADSIRALARGLMHPFAKANEAGSTPTSFGEVLTVYCKQTILMAPMSFLLQLLHPESATVMLIGGIFTAAIAGVLATALEIKMSAEKARRNFEKETAVAPEASYLYFAEKVYQKLSRLANSTPESRQLCAEMESHPAFSAHLERWRGSPQPA